MCPWLIPTGFNYYCWGSDGFQIKNASWQTYFYLNREYRCPSMVSPPFDSLIPTQDYAKSRAFTLIYMWFTVSFSTQCHEGFAIRRSLESSGWCIQLTRALTVDLVRHKCHASKEIIKVPLSHGSFAASVLVQKSC